mmetsp:Transcript_41148/g.116474  ORF Transcript_41148/g.116474 Transcript_41148/m.116474 type:complete len:524 (+) Transcript_41148:268-1839(+)
MCQEADERPQGPDFPELVLVLDAALAEGGHCTRGHLEQGLVVPALQGPREPGAPAVLAGGVLVGLVVLDEHPDREAALPQQLLPVMLRGVVRLGPLARAAAGRPPLDDLHDGVQAPGLTDRLLVPQAPVGHVAEGLGGVLQEHGVVRPLLREDVDEGGHHAQLEGLLHILLQLGEQGQGTHGVEAGGRRALGEEGDEGPQAPALPDGVLRGLLLGEAPDDPGGLLHDDGVLRAQEPHQELHGARLSDGEAVLLGLREGHQGAEAALQGGHEGRVLQDPQEEEHAPGLADRGLDAVGHREVPEGAGGLLLQHVVRGRAQALDEPVDAAGLRDRLRAGPLRPQVREGHRGEGPQRQGVAAPEERGELRDAAHPLHRGLALVVDGQVQERAHGREADRVRGARRQQLQHAAHAVQLADAVAVGRLQREVAEALGRLPGYGHVGLRQEADEYRHPVVRVDLRLALLVHGHVLEGAHGCAHPCVAGGGQETHQHGDAPSLSDGLPALPRERQVLEAVRGELLRAGGRP